MQVPAFEIFLILSGKVCSFSLWIFWFSFQNLEIFNSNLNYFAVPIKPPRSTLLMGNIVNRLYQSRFSTTVWTHAFPQSFSLCFFLFFLLVASNKAENSRPPFNTASFHCLFFPSCYKICYFFFRRYKNLNNTVATRGKSLHAAVHSLQSFDKSMDQVSFGKFDFVTKLWFWPEKFHLNLNFYFPVPGVAVRSRIAQWNSRSNGE